MNYQQVFKKNAFALLALGIFVLLVIPASMINFYQNDDWCYYLTVENFMKGVFQLHPYLGPTFYLQGIVGALYSSIFGIQHLPVLTLAIACINMFIFMKIINKFLGTTVLDTILLGLMFFSTPLGVYELWGFMTNHYFMTTLLLGFYFFLKYEKTGKKTDLLGYTLAILGGLLVRQVALVLPLAVVAKSLFEKRFRFALYNFLVFTLLYAFYSKVLPLTPRIAEVPLQFQHLLKFDYSYAIVYGSLIIVTAYLLPLFVHFVDFRAITSSRKKTLGYIFVCATLFIGLNKIYKPETISWGEFPYFENTIERTGFFPRNIHGTKYQFAGNYKLWNYWDIVSKVVLAMSLTYIALYRFDKRNIFLLYCGAYLGLMIITETYYDRYIYTIIPISIMYLMSQKPFLQRATKIMLATFLLVISYLCYLFSADFLLLNHYVWNKSVALSIQKNLDKSEILGTKAWGFAYKNAQNYKYVFSYDSPKVNEDFASNYKLIEEHTINYPANFFIKPNIYLYENIEK